MYVRTTGTLRFFQLRFLRLAVLKVKQNKKNSSKPHRKITKITQRVLIRSRSQGFGQSIETLLLPTYYYHAHWRILTWLTISLRVSCSSLARSPFSIIFSLWKDGRVSFAGHCKHEIKYYLERVKLCHCLPLHCISSFPLRDLVSKKTQRKRMSVISWSES